MAHVKINSGELPSAIGVEGKALHDVLAKWQSVAQGSFRQDCRALLQMVDETDQLRLWEKQIGGISSKDRNDFLRYRVLIDFDLTEQTLTDIVERLRRGETANLPKHEIGVKGGKGGPGRGKKTGSNTTRLFGRGAAYTLARLDRDGHIELATQVRAHTMSANAAALKMGWRKRPTALDQLRKAWKAATKNERAIFRSEIT